MSESEVNKVYEMDCVEGMNNLEESSVDVVVTSPPYNIGMEYNTHDDNLPFEDYLDWMEEVAEAVSHVLKPDGSFFLNIGDKPSDEFRSFKVAERVSDHFELQNTIHWVKHIAVPSDDLKGESDDINIGHYKPVNSYRYINNCHEYIFHFSLSGQVEVDKLSIGVPYADKSNVNRWDSAGEDLRDRGNIWYIPYETVSGTKSHPAAFPKKLPKMCAKLHGITGEEVLLDPFLGSGSTAAAARDLGVDYIGFEIDEEYARISRERLSQKRLGEEQQ